MNWKRGLTRIYVVVWGLFVCFGIYVAINYHNSVQDNVAILNDFLRRHPDVTIQQLKDGYRPPPETLQEMIDRESDFQKTDFNLAQGVVYEYHPIWKHYAQGIALWLGIFLLAPAAIFGTLHWVIAGFQRPTERARPPVTPARGCG